MLKAFSTFHSKPPGMILAVLFGKGLPGHIHAGINLDI